MQSIDLASSSFGRILPQCTCPASNLQTFQASIDRQSTKKKGIIMICKLMEEEKRSNSIYHNSSEADKQKQKPPTVSLAFFWVLTTTKTRLLSKTKDISALDHALQHSSSESLVFFQECPQSGSIFNYVMPIYHLFIRSLAHAFIHIAHL